MTARIEKAGIDRRQFFITTGALGGALVVGAGSSARAYGAAVPVFTALPGREAKLERELPFER